MTLPRVLFVDDEQDLLAGLRNLLRKERSKWDMVFAVGADAALRELEQSQVDVVVSDMRMPGVDGPALLNRVKQSWPRTVRLVLSGHADEEGLFRAIPVCHQFLSKPCDANVLKAAIHRACDLNWLQSDERIRAAIGGLADLPSVPEVCSALKRAVTRRGASLAEIAAIVERDPAMSIRALQVAGSPYVGLPVPATSIREAVKILGLDVIQGMVVDAQLFSLAPPVVEGFSPDSTSRHVLATARLARKFLADTPDADTAFAAGLVHEVGRLVLAVSMPDRLLAVARLAVERGVSARVAEKEILGITHAEIGAALLGAWGLPLPIVDTVAHHHEPSRALGRGHAVLAAVHVADVFAEMFGEPTVGSVRDAELDMPFLENVGMAAQLDRWRAIAEDAHDVAGP